MINEEANKSASEQILNRWVLGVLSEQELDLINFIAEEKHNLELKSVHQTIMALNEDELELTNEVALTDERPEVSINNNNFINRWILGCMPQEELDLLEELSKHDAEYKGVFDAIHSLNEDYLENEANGFAEDAHIQLKQLGLRPSVPTKHTFVYTPDFSLAAADKIEVKPDASDTSYPRKIVDKFRKTIRVIDLNEGHPGIGKITIKSASATIFDKLVYLNRNGGERFWSISFHDLQDFNGSTSLEITYYTGKDLINDPGYQELINRLKSRGALLEAQEVEQLRSINESDA